MSIATNLKHWRQVRGLTQPELAERAEIEQSYLSKLENGHSQASEGVRERLAEALGIDVDTLLRDPSRNSHARQLALGSLAALLLLVVGFLGGYLASGYELREIDRESQRLERFWALTGSDVTIQNIVELQDSDGTFNDERMIVGNYTDRQGLEQFIGRLLDSGVMGNELYTLSVNERVNGFVLRLRGNPRLESTTIEKSNGFSESPLVRKGSTEGAGSG